MEMTVENPRYISTIGLTQEQWLAIRQRGIGGSDAGAVLGLSTYKTAYDIWEEKVAPIPISSEQSERMEWGKRLEDVIADAWEEKTGLKIRYDRKVRFHPEIPYLLVNLDRTIVQSNGNGPGILECKNADAFTQEEWQAGIPYYYYAQVQHEMLVTGYKWGELAVLFGGWAFRRYSFEWDQSFIDQMLPVYDDFWNKHVVTKIPPVCKTDSDCQKRWPKGDPSLQVIADDTTIKVVAEALYAKELANDFARQQREGYIQIKNIMGEAEILLDKDGLILATYRGKEGKRRLNLKGESEYGSTGNNGSSGC